jgi:hypothetical protein
MRHDWREFDRDYCGTRLFFAGIALMCSPVIIAPFAYTMAILAIVYGGAVITILGMLLALAEWPR